MEVRFEFKDISFREKKGLVEATFLDIFYFDIEKDKLEDIGSFRIKDGAIIFPYANEKKAQKKFDLILNDGFNNLKNRLSANPAVYVHQNSGIPLIGSNSFGLVDRDTNLIELKPITSCNLGCIFCSVDEGIGTKKKLDFVVEKDYLLEGFRELAKKKEGCSPLYAYINVHGEPMLYSPIIELIKDLKTFPNVITGIITNGTLLSEEKIDRLAEAGLDRINISLCAMDNDLADKLAGTAYNLKRILKIIRYASSRLDTVVAPVYLKGLNDKEMPRIIDFIKSVREETKGTKQEGFPLIGIQNFLAYKKGRNPVKQESWEVFNDLMDRWAKDAHISLGEDNFYKIIKTSKLKKPFRKGDILRAKVVSKDRYPGQCIASAENRCITVFDCTEKPGKEIKIRIVSDKHNIFTATKA